MKCFYTLSIFCFTSVCAFSQDFSGYRTGNYTGVNGVFFNPANIADSRYRFDFNLFSVNSGIGNNQASFNINHAARSFRMDSLENQLFGKNAGSSAGMSNMDFHGPSLMFNAGEKVAVALTTRGRMMSNVADVDGKLVDKIISDANGSASLPYTIASGNDMRMNVNTWAEFGLSIAGVLADRDMHFLKGGVTFKYLAGVANGYMNVANLNSTIEWDQAYNEPYLANTTGKVALGFGGMNIDDISRSEFRGVESSGFGGDIGFVYEFRPEYENYRMSSDSWRRDLNKYKVKIGVALLDVGGITYHRDVRRSGGYTLNITGNERFYLDKLANANPDDFKDTLNSMPQLFTPDLSNNESSYMVSLPTTLHVDLDYHLNRGFYVNIATQFALSDSKSKTFNSHYYHAFTITPRFEGRGLGIYVPFNYNELTSFNAGLSLRVGPVFIGSGSVLTAMFGESKQADFYFGVKLGALQKNKEKKSNRKDKELQEDYRRSYGRNF